MRLAWVFGAFAAMIVGSAPVGWIDTAEAAAAHVHIQGFAFNPLDLQINDGDTVTWHNHDLATHTATDLNCPRAGGPGPCEFDSFNLGNGGTFQHTFNGAASFDYECTIHHFTGTVSVAEPGGTPDLTVLDIVPSFDPPVAQDALTFAATVKNLGNAQAGAFKVRFLLDGATSLGDIAVAALGAGASLNVVSNVWTAVEGDHTIRANADVLGAVVETNEANNERQENVHVDPLIRLVELTPEDQEKKVLLPGNSAVYTITVKNAGNRPDTVNLEIGPAPGGWTATLNVQAVNNLGAGATSNVQLTVKTALIPLSGLEGDVAVTGRSQGDPAKTDTANTHTRILL